MSWMYLTALIVLFLAGLGIGWAWGRSGNEAQRKAKSLEAALQQTRNDLEQYKSQVTAHFAATAELMQRLTEDYRAVYRHLAEGSERLCGPDAPRLPGEPTPENLLQRQAAQDEGTAETPRQSGTEASEETSATQTQAEEQAPPAPRDETRAKADDDTDKATAQEANATQRDDEAASQTQPTETDAAPAKGNGEAPDEKTPPPSAHPGHDERPPKAPLH